MLKKILIVLMLYGIGASMIFPQLKNEPGQYPALDLMRFYDSAHHWYDITDQDKIIHPLENHPRYNGNEIIKIADNILLFQKDNGGWAKNYDMTAILNYQQKDSVMAAKKIFNTTFDNGTTYSQLTYLAEVYSITKEEKYKQAFLRGLDFIFTAQYLNGGLPQFSPQMEGYARYITFNDGAMIGVMNLLKNIIDNKKDYTFVDDAYSAKVKKAFDKGITCILKCQIKENGKLLAWCQQHDEINFKPQWARTFEPPSICNSESCGIVELLMDIKDPSKEIINSIQGAVKWFEDSKIFNTRLETIKAPKKKFLYQTTSIDRRVVHDTTAPPIWTRFYELKTHRPLFCDRGRKIYYSLDKVDRERRAGYKYYTEEPQKILNLYSAWQKQWVPDQNVLKGK